MQEALIVAVLTFVGLIALAILINVIVNAVFSLLDRRCSVTAQGTNARFSNACKRPVIVGGKPLSGVTLSVVRDFETTSGAN